MIRGTFILFNGMIILVEPGEIPLNRPSWVMTGKGILASFFLLSVDRIFIITSFIFENLL